MTGVVCMLFAAKSHTGLLIDMLRILYLQHVADPAGPTLHVVVCADM